MYPSNWAKNNMLRIVVERCVDLVLDAKSHIVLFKYGNIHCGKGLPHPYPN